jgi:hypothetical protein
MMELVHFGLSFFLPHLILSLFNKGILRQSQAKTMYAAKKKSLFEVLQAKWTILLFITTKSRD